MAHIIQGSTMRVAAHAEAARAIAHAVSRANQADVALTIAYADYADYAVLAKIAPHNAQVLMTILDQSDQHGNGRLIEAISVMVFK